MLPGATILKASLVAITSFVITVGSMEVLPHHPHSRSHDAITPRSTCTSPCSVPLPIHATTPLGLFSLPNKPCSAKSQDLTCSAIFLLVLYLLVPSSIAVGYCPFRLLHACSSLYIYPIPAPHERAAGNVVSLGVCMISSLPYLDASQKLDFGLLLCFCIPLLQVTVSTFSVLMPQWCFDVLVIMQGI
jgi:hypothetical protein